jgi:(S)-mandelate dehydrogenase
MANTEYTAAEKFDTESWVKLGDLDQLSYDSLREMARRRLPRGIFEYVDRGTEDEAGLLHNRRRFDEIRLLPNVLVDAAARSQRIELFGQSCSLPLVIAPTAAAGLLWHRGEIHLAKAGAKAGIPYCAATEAISPLEVIAAAAKGNIWFQLYFWRDRSLSYGLIDRARAAGIDTLVVTVDAIVPPKREYNARNGFDVPLKPSLRGAWDVATHPRWFTQVLLRYLLSEGMPTHGNYPDGYRAKITRGKPADAVRMDPSLDWGDIAALRKYWRGNLVIKGILSPDDAVKAVSHGIDAIVVSNHGGRDLDSAVAPVDVLPEIIGRTGDRLVVLADSSVRRGSDVVKLLALGARAVLVGRAFLYGTAAAGEAGAGAAIAMLGDEIDRAMALLGCRSVKEIGPHLLRTG